MFFLWQLRSLRTAKSFWFLWRVRFRQAKEKASVIAYRGSNADTNLMDEIMAGKSVKRSGRIGTSSVQDITTLLRLK